MFLIILNRASRFDLISNPQRLITGNAGTWFDFTLQKYGLNRATVTIWTAEQFFQKKLIPPQGTKGVLFLGEEAFRLKHPDNRVSLQELRGYPYKDDQHGYIYLSSFAPQDAMDVQDWEGKFNPANDDDEAVVERSTDDSDADIKAHGTTRRKNYRFWLTKDIGKWIRLTHTGTFQQRTLNFSHDIYPNAEDVIRSLSETKNQYLHFDIETDPQTKDITVFSFCFENVTDPLLTGTLSPVYIVPVRKYDYEPAYSICELSKIFRALAVSLRDNTLVTHNGHGFDLLILLFKYKIPFGDNHFDTMVAHHRIYPEVEKSLGHVLSLYTDEPYHKNESDGGYVPFNSEQERNLWMYNAKDVAVMPWLRSALQREASRMEALKSTEEAMDLIPVYLTLTARGIRVNRELINTRLIENNRRVTQYLRILKILVGRDINPQSPKQMKEYLFNTKTGLGLKPVSYTKKGEPKTDEKALLKLSIKHELPVVPVILEIRRVGKLSSMMEFNEIPKIL